MPMHEEDPHGHKPEEVDASAGYEQTDVRVTGILVFLVSLAIFVAVCGVLTIGMGHLINAWMDKQDGPTSKWATTVDVRQLGNLPNNPELQHKMAELTKQFPTPRVQTDDGNQDVADLHQRENLLLENYSRIDGTPGKVRIPIERAMELIAQRGLPVAPAQTNQAALMAGDSKLVVVVPLTDGFAPTAYEQDEAEARTAGARQKQ